eukprot:GHRQ01034701.1.p1 GENE.GHRQ01034701.1~~GHRQ01034701.1.p1  ORF type:complete len:135 (-),score=20.42 GHRQ01034701.1:557-940(-)
MAGLHGRNWLFGIGSSSRAAHRSYHIQSSTDISPGRPSAMLLTRCAASCPAATAQVLRRAAAVAPLPATHSLPSTLYPLCIQVRCYMGDNEQRWYMWYSGSSAPLAGLAGVAPAAGSIGKVAACSCS